MLAAPDISGPLDGDLAPVGVLVLNFNGRALLEECLPSVLAAAEASRHVCQVVVIDNGSTDQSVEFLEQRFPSARVIRRPNRGLCSFNDVLAELPCRVAVLLNNDIKLDLACIDHLVEPLLAPFPLAGEGRSEGQSATPHLARRCFMTAPRSWLFDGVTHEGFKTAVQWRWGLVQATALFPGHEEVVDLPGPTASAGAALAVDRRLFLELGGFDPLYLPGRIEDLDFAYRGYVAGHQALYVPQAIAYHRGMATFGPAFSQHGCDQLALRNTLLFQWKNLRHPAHVLRQAVGLPLRLLRDAMMASFLSRRRRFATWRALDAARRRIAEARAERRDNATVPGSDARSREMSFFREFHSRAMIRQAKSTTATAAGSATISSAADAPSKPLITERLRDQRHPISRWYLLPLANWAASWLSATTIRPWHVSVTGAALAIAAALSMSLGLSTMAALLVLAVWFCDRLDGKLARHQRTATRWGAWLDANLDELTDLGLHAALALATAAAWQSSLPWGLFTAFVVGKYLFIYGVTSDQSAAGMPSAHGREQAGEASLVPLQRAWLRRLYHLPGNADVRMHLLALLLAAGWWSAELLFVAAYFNLRWIVRYVLVARREIGPLATRDRAREADHAVDTAWQARQTRMSASREMIA